MTSLTPPPPTLDRYLADALTVGEPDVAGPLAVFPVFGPAPVVEYLAFSQARPAGFAVRELEDGASVNDLDVANPTRSNVLLYEGEEVLGAQQNRVFDVSVLVAAGAKLRVPVSCVEAGRWDGGRHHESFFPAPQAAYPALRRLKNEQARASGRAVQGAVWSEVASKSRRHATVSATGALNDVFEQQGDRLGDLIARVTIRPEQSGALVALGGRLDVLDWVSRPDVFEALHEPLVRGYALDALEARKRPAPSVDEAQEWLSATLACPVRERDGIGAGRDVRFEGQSGTGAATVTGEELIQLTAFAPQASRSSARVQRPSRRRRA